MNCKKCARPIPEKATKCHHCYNRTGYSLDDKKFPSSDMYGGQIFEVLPNSAKENIRGQYLESLPEFVESKKQQKEMVKRILLCILGFFIGIPLIGILLFGCIMLATISPAIGIILGILVVAGGVSAGIIAMVKLLKYNKPHNDFKKKIGIHENKLRYYANDYIFGFSVLDHISSDDDRRYYYYAFYEVEKNNIKGFSYDSRYGEYVLLTYRPTYMHYDFAPAYEFRIPDVFDDHVLVNIFGCDMPPKNIPF